jgi:pyruvate dehydrogenase E2 component (dihydrolipoamide acetyltransferase)
MATRVMMEALSPTMEEGRLVQWLKQVGDTVASGDVLAEVETDKAIMELVARGDGVLRARLVDDGATTPVGQLIGVIAADDEDITALVGGGAAPAASAQEPAGGTAGGADDAGSRGSTAGEAAPGAQAVVTSTTAADAGRRRSSPLARRLAAERGVALDTLAGSGPGGRIIRRDIEAAAAAPPAQSASPAALEPAAARTPVAAASAPAFAGESRDLPLTQMRKTIARRLSESIGPVPTFYLTAEIDMTRAVELREQMTEAGEQFKVSINDIILKAVATALTRHPECNAHWLGDRIREFARVHLGMAVATDDGLIVPVITDAHAKGLGQIGREARELAKKARERKLTPAEYSGSTFSVSNLGMFGIDQFTAIINPPEAAILAVGGIETVPAWRDGAVVPRQRMRVTMSCDHRVIDGAVGARFLQTLTRMLENPLQMLY